MPTSRQFDPASALATEESPRVDFKAKFDASLPQAWVELVKDIVAFANSGGGVIIFGVDDDGSLSGADLAQLREVDTADVTNKLYKYTDRQFSNFSFNTAVRGGAQVIVLEIGEIDVPMVFTKPGTYASPPPPGSQKTAFPQGAVYFRHGTKSEPGNSDDLRAFIDRRLEGIRRSWLDGIAKVVEAPPGATITIVAPAVPSSPLLATFTSRLVDDPSAPPVYAVPIDQTHPHRQMNVVADVNGRIGKQRKITTHHLLCIRRVYEIDNKREFCYKQRYASTRYSVAFVDWIVARFQENPRFFDETKQQYDGRTSA